MNARKILLIIGLVISIFSLMWGRSLVAIVTISPPNVTIMGQIYTLDIWTQVLVSLFAFILLLNEYLKLKEIPPKRDTQKRLTED